MKQRFIKYLDKQVEVGFYGYTRMEDDYSVKQGMCIEVTDKSIFIEQKNEIAQVFYSDLDYITFKK